MRKYKWLDTKLGTIFIGIIAFGGWIVPFLIFASITGNIINYIKNDGVVLRDYSGVQCTEYDYDSLHGGNVCTNSEYVVEPKYELTLSEAIIDDLEAAWKLLILSVILGVPFGFWFWNKKQNENKNKN